MIIHVVAWNRRKPSTEILGLTYIFFLFPSFILIITYIATYLTIIPATTTELTASGLLYLSLAAAYIQIYPAFTCEIPTFKILRLIANSGKSGITFEQIRENFDPDELIGSRITLLKADCLITIDGENNIKLTIFGCILATVFILYRRLCGLETGGG